MKTLGEFIAELFFLSVCGELWVLNKNKHHNMHILGHF